MLDKPQSLEPAFRIKKKAEAVNSNKLRNTSGLKEQLMREMLELDKQKQKLEIGANTMDFSMIQTYKEMIQSRRALLDQLNQPLA